MLEPIGRDYLYSELVNPVFTKDGDNAVSYTHLDVYKRQPLCREGHGRNKERS